MFLKKRIYEGNNLLFKIYTTVEKNSARARKIKILSVNSLRLYLVNNRCPVRIRPDWLFSSSLVSLMVLDEVTEKKCDHVVMFGSNLTFTQKRTVFKGTT